ncbi:TetR/AcrR family transcriptional regulator [Planococcus sp. YIM B11945]|uniref:TetR/AcrR family transcriptional regulator n=1 Tax=Planococcus sp. YIM B11945 TaxID=3435410 RepID=UPI003D7D0D41
MKVELIEQSTKLFVEKGFSATSIQDIVDALGVTKGSFYYHFKSKEALLMDIHLRYIDDLLRRQKAIVENGKTCRDKLVNVVELLIGDIEKQGAVGRVYFRELRHLSKGNAAIIRAKRAEFRGRLEAIIKEGIQSGEFRDSLEPKITTFAVLGVTNWSYQWFNPEGALTAQELADRYADFILHGMSAPEK